MRPGRNPARVMKRQEKTFTMTVNVSYWRGAALAALMLAVPLQQAAAKPRVSTNFTAVTYVNGKPLATRKAVRSVRKGTNRRARLGRIGMAQSGSRRAGRAACAAAARRHGVPVRTALAVCFVESSFRCNAVGAAGELGLLQIKLATARMLGYRGSRNALKRCSTGAYWGMKHLALAIRKGGVWKHNQGIGAKRPSRMARIYAAKVSRAQRRF